MVYSKGYLISTLAFASLTLASVIEERAAKVSTKIITTTITSATVVAVPTTINMAISATGVTTIIPGALTMTFSQLPAYLYIETFTAATSYVTKVSTSTTKITVTASTTAKATSTAETTSTAKIGGSSTGTKITSTAISSTSTAATASSTVNPLTGPYIDHWDGSTFYQTPGSQCLYQATPGTMSGGTSFQTTDNPTCQTDCQTDSHCVSYSWQPSTLTCTKYTTTFDGNVVASTNSGIYFSDKYGSPGYGHLSTGCNNPSL